VHSIPWIRWSHAYLIVDDTLDLVDTGLPWDAGRIVRYIEPICRRPDEPGMVLTTHSHPVHTTGSLSITRRADAEVIAHTADTRPHADRAVSLSYLGVFGALKVPVPFLRRTPSRTIGDGDVLPFFGGIRTIHTRRLTQGSLCFLLRSRGLPFSGGTVFSDEVRVQRSVPFLGASVLLYKESLEQLAELDFDILCGGHGSPLVCGASEALRKLL